MVSGIGSVSLAVSTQNYETWVAGAGANPWDYYHPITTYVRS